MHLGTCVAAKLQRRAHVPVRNHPLTFLLQDCLGGQGSKCVFFLLLSPAAPHAAETKRTLEFGKKLLFSGNA